MELFFENEILLKFLTTSVKGCKALKLDNLCQKKNISLDQLAYILMI